MFNLTVLIDLACLALAVFIGAMVINVLVMLSATYKIWREER